MFKQQKDLELYQTENNNAHIDDVETVEEEDEYHVDFLENEGICGNLNRVVTNEDRLKQVEGYMSRSMSGIHLSGPLRCKFDNSNKNMDKTKYRYFCDNKLETGVKLPPLADMHRGLNRKFSE